MMQIKRSLVTGCCLLGATMLSAQSQGTQNDTLYRDLQSDTWVATDALGRSLPGYAECGPRKENRFVGMFYFVTHNNNGAKEGPYNVTEILAADPAPN